MTPLPRVCLAAVLLAALAAPLSVAAQTPHATSSAPIQQQASASLGHAAAKGVSLKIINGVVGMAVFTTGTGSLAAGSVLAASVAATSFSVFVINDYIWDHYFPNTNVAANGESFNTAWSIGRNTAKFLTFKPAVMVPDWSAIYLYTRVYGIDAHHGTGLLAPIAAHVLCQQCRVGLVRLVEHTGPRQAHAVTAL